MLLARLGANVVVNDVNEKHAKAVVDEITRGSRNQTTVSAVITDYGAC